MFIPESRVVWSLFSVDSVDSDSTTEDSEILEAVRIWNSIITTHHPDINLRMFLPNMITVFLQALIPRIWMKFISTNNTTEYCFDMVDPKMGFFSFKVTHVTDKRFPSSWFMLHFNVCLEDFGAKYLVFFSSCSLKTREKCILHQNKLF